MRKRGIALLALSLAVVTVVASLAGCSKPAAKPSAVTYVVYADPMVDWDPAKSWAAENVFMQNVYETLVRIDPLDNNKFTGVLATGWHESEDHLTWTFDIRPNVKFHDGETLTADMAAKSLKRTIDMKKSATYIFDGVKDIKAAGPLTLEFDLSRPLPMLYILSSTYAAYIYNPDYSTDWYTTPNADGTGPYKFVSYKKDSEIVLQKFDDYWGGWSGSGKFEYAFIKTVTEAATRRQMLTSGEADIVEQMPVEDIQALKSDANIATSNVTSFQELYAFLNTQKAPLNNKYIRQALAYATPYADILNYVMGGTAVQARGVIPQTLWGYSPDVFQYTYDLDKAKALLTKGGKPNGGFTLLYTYTAGDKNEQKIGELMKDSFAKIGITLDIRGMTVDTKYALARDPDPQKRQDITMLYWWPDNVDPSGYLYSQFHTEKEVGFNLGYYYNPAVDKLIDDGMLAAGTSIDAAVAKYTEAQKIIVDDSPAIFLYCENYVRPYRADLQGFKDNPAYPNVVFFYDLSRSAK